MKILHTSDWHIGKKLMGRDRYDEYEAVLSEIASVCRERHIGLVLVAGDVFDTYVPTAEAERIFYNGVKKIAKYSAVLIISGNHDDYVRLSAAATFAQESNVYIVGNDFRQIECGKRGEVFPVKAEAGYVVFSDSDGEKVYINTLPYPNEARFKEGRTEETFEEKISRWIDFGQRGNTEGLPSVFLSHIFVSGGVVSDSEREIDLGGARVVPVSLLPKCDYCALGHLHKRQNLKNNAFYSGAIMQFTFDEAYSEKSVNVFDIGKDGISGFERVALVSFKKLIRLQANDVGSAVDLLNANSACLVELTLNIGQPLTPSENKLLHSCENLVSLRVNVENIATTYEKVSNKNKTSSQLFCDFYKSKFNCEPSKELLALFLSLTEDDETD